ncbi:MAG: DeoR/GlpR transcriptional regulator [Paludibacteraceae bacterium]|nr:DeoR/GlpR transcriptional regulator [Paludibacteraceae bacterium]MBR1481327.1 DeoR/GlpR transcriptional regulator [Paludibacteraceae bacterium]
MNPSSAKERRALILRMLEQKEEVQVTELSRETGISEVTIRKDLTLLQNRRLLVRTRGGAMRRPVENQNEDTAIAKKRMFNFKEKERIGEEAAKMIKNGDFIMLDSGTTTLEVARHLERFHDLHIVTNAMNIATELMNYKRFEVILLGGNVRVNSHSTVGPLALSVLRNFSGYKLFLGVDSFSTEDGVSTPSLEEALLNQTMIQQAGQVIAVFDSSKFNKRSFVHIAAADELDCIITDRAIPTGMLSKLRNAGIEVRIV